MKIIFTRNAWEDYISWLHDDRKMLKKINDLIKDIQRNPFEGKGKPEPLKYDHYPDIGLEELTESIGWFIRPMKMRSESMLVDTIMTNRNNCVAKRPTKFRFNMGFWKFA